MTPATQTSPATARFTSDSCPTSSISPRVDGVYRVVRDQPDALFDLIKLAEYNAETFEWSKRSEPGDDAVQLAFRFLLRNRFSRGGLGRDFAWSDRPRGGQPGDLNYLESWWR
jgi:hypothetical protein